MISMTEEERKEKFAPIIKTWEHQQYSDIIDGHPVSCGMGGLDGTEKPLNQDVRLFSDLTDDEQEYVRKWIDGLQKTKISVLDRSSYGLKHIIEADSEEETGNRIYLTNNQMKDALLQAGFEPEAKYALNWRYKISKNSPSLRKKRNRIFLRSVS
jgi:hypothetical protein